MPSSSSTINKLVLANDHSWTITLSNKTVVTLGRQQVIQHLEQLVNVYNKVFDNSKKPPKSIDMRYKHGMAVQNAD